MSALIKRFGSLRRLLDAYWRGQLQEFEEIAVEDNMRKEDIYGFKPIDC